MKNQKGVALLVTLFAILIMIFLAVEIAFNTHVELKVGAAQLDRLKAFYLAKSGVELSLLRINVYKSVMAKYGGQLGSAKGQLDMIWQFPFSWPPMIPEGSSDFDKVTAKGVIAKSFIDGAFTTTIEGESGKINLNDLASPSEQLRQAVNAQLVQLIQNRLNQDDDWAHDHQNLKPQEIVNNIADWVTPGEQSLNGGGKSSYYEQPMVPPGRDFKTLDELHDVYEVSDDIFNLIAPVATVYGVKGINVNYCNADVLRSIDARITPEIAAAAVSRRQDLQNGGPFQNAQDLTGFFQSQGMNVQNFNTNPVIPLLFDAEYNFKIKSTGVYGKAQREIVAIVYDFDKVKQQLSTMLASASPSPGQVQQPGQPPPPPPGASPSPSPPPADAGAGGPPQIVFWQEF